jgi:hypothetical protein
MFSNTLSLCSSLNIRDQETWTVNYKPTSSPVNCMDLSDSISANALLFAQNVMQMVKYFYVRV